VHLLTVLLSVYHLAIDHEELVFLDTIEEDARVLKGKEPLKKRPNAQVYLGQVSFREQGLN
jgi:hypothetical protein